MAFGRVYARDSTLNADGRAGAFLQQVDAVAPRHSGEGLRLAPWPAHRQARERAKRAETEVELLRAARKEAARRLELLHLEASVGEGERHTGAHRRAVLPGLLEPHLHVVLARAAGAEEKRFGMLDGADVDVE